MTETNKDIPFSTDEESDALAAELALGLLEGEEAKTAVARLSSDPAFAQAVRDWQERFAIMGENMTSVMPPARAWQTIREKLGHGTAPLTEDPTVPLSWWRGPKGWLAGFITIAAVVALIWMPWQTPAPSDGPGYQAQLVTEDEALQVSVVLDGGEMEVSLNKGTAAEGRDLEIWWIEPDGSAPISLGLVPHSGSLRLDLPEGTVPAEGVKIALSDEPAGGSTTGVATGEIVAAADLTNS